MKNKIIKNSLFILLASVLTLPLTSTKILADSGIHLPTLESFNWPIVSLHGPRLVLNKDGSVCTGCTKFHAGIDFSPLPGNADLGYMIKSRTEGDILDFIKGSSGGWRLVVRPPSAIESLHGAKDFFYMHLFQNNGTVPVIQKSENGYTKVEVVDVTKSLEVDGSKILKKCKGIAFWKGKKDDMTLAKVLTKKKDCHGGIYGTHTDVPATSKVSAFEEIAPIGNSNNSTIKAHLHFGMNFGTGSSEKDNPFYALKRTATEPVESFFSAELLKDPKNPSQLVSSKGFWVDVTSGTEYSLDKVNLQIIKKDGGIVPLPQFSFGGRPGEFRENLNDDQVVLIPTDQNCGKSPTGSYSQPITQACDWDEKPPKKWRFFVPYDITSLPAGTHQLCTKMTSVNGYSNTKDSCETFGLTSVTFCNYGLGDSVMNFYIDGMDTFSIEHFGSVNHIRNDDTCECKTVQLFSGKKKINIDGTILSDRPPTETWPIKPYTTDIFPNGAATVERFSTDFGPDPWPDGPYYGSIYHGILYADYCKTFIYK